MGGSGDPRGVVASRRGERCKRCSPSGGAGRCAVGGCPGEAGQSRLASAHPLSAERGKGLEAKGRRKSNERERERERESKIQTEKWIRNGSENEAGSKITRE